MAPLVRQALQQQRACRGAGMPTLTEIVVHEQLTQRSGYRYQFTPKHHGADAEAGQWLPDLSLEEEFAVFDTADEHMLTDDNGYLYGVQRESYESLRFLGTWYQQVAEFPTAREGEAWHGYPVYPLQGQGPENRRGQKCRPQKVVFSKMMTAGLISDVQRRRLMKGDYA
jgi:hypothetical protein